ncbi:MAG TPA: SurA N-terminal domain-containing protein, partial [Methyloceanibacter sp.]
GLPCAAQEQTEQSIVVLVNDDPITVYDVEQRQRFLAVTTQEQPSPALKKKATDMLIEERLQIQQGRKLGITPDEDEVNKVLGGMAQNNKMSPDQLGAALGQMGVNIKTLRDRIRSQVVWQDVVRKKFRRDVSIGEADVDRALTDAGDQGKPKEETTLQLRQVRYEIPTEADQAAIAKQLAAIEAIRAKVQSCSNISTLTKDIKGFKVKTLQDQLPGSLGQPMRTLVMNAKVGQMTPPTLSGSAIEAYAVCGKHAVKGDPEKRQQAQVKLMEQELGIRAEGLLRDMRQDAFIEYR